MVNPHVTDSPPWKVEIYKNDVMPSDAFTADELAAAQHDYITLNMTLLAKRAAQAQVSPEIGHCMTQHELDVWTWRYPTIYQSNFHVFGGVQMQSRFFQARRAWAELEWSLPKEVRTLALTAQDRYDRLEIWVPELRRAPQNMLSPILVGVRANNLYLLARWAEALEPLEDIEQRMNSQEGKRATKIRSIITRNNLSATDVHFGASILTAFTLIAAAGAVFGSSDLVVPAGFVAVVFASLAGLVWRSAYLRRSSSIKWACSYAGWVMR